MKKSIIILFLILNAYLTINAQQRFNAGLKAGFAATQVEGDTYTGFDKFGVAAAAFMVGKISEKYSAQFELLFIQKGSKHNGDINKGDYVFYTMKLNYIEVPVLFQYHQKKIIYEAGPSLGYLISAKEYNYSGQYNSGIPFKSSEIGFGLGLSYAFSNSLGINCRYSNSLLAIRQFDPKKNKWYDPGQRNNALMLTIMYTFGTVPK